jgi:AmmeMemoRadiSam system protein A
MIIINEINEIFNMPLNSERKEFLLSLARKTLEVYFKDQKKLRIDESEVDSILLKLTATFVTLTIDDKLRGCVGELVARRPLYQSIINNTLSAALDDNRFLPLNEAELPSVSIEISILSKNTKYNRSDSIKNLLDQIIPNEHGVILESGSGKATYLPQVWDDLPNKITFLESLSQKAGLPPNAWKDKDAILSYYSVEHFDESR